MTDNNDTLYEFAIIGPVGAWNEGDVTDTYWGRTSERPLTRKDIGELIECCSDNTPVTWEESICGIRGTFESYAYEDDEWKPYVVVLDKVTPARLAELAEDGNPDAREVVAAYPNTPPEVLAELAQDDDYWVRMSVAKNPSTPLEVLAQLAQDEVADVRENVANNPNTPPEVLAELAQDEAPMVAQAAAQNPNTPDAGLTPEASKRQLDAELAQNEVRPNQRSPRRR
jgi:hypothetical protein